MQETRERVEFGELSLPDGRVFGRVEMQTDLRLAAIALKLPSENIGTHSLRVSCATWLYQAGYDLEYIKRHGRWASNVVHVYTHSNGTNIHQFQTWKSALGNLKLLTVFSDSNF